MNLTTSAYGDLYSSSSSSYYEYDCKNFNTYNTRVSEVEGRVLPCSCGQEGHAMIGIPLAMYAPADSNGGTEAYQSAFDLTSLIDRTRTYIVKMGVNEGWMQGEDYDENTNGIAAIPWHDTSFLRIFDVGTTNDSKGGISTKNLVAILSNLYFDPLYIKPAFVYVTSQGHVRLQFEADSTTALGALYDKLCSQLGVMDLQTGKTAWNSEGAYTSCSFHLASDTAANGCSAKGYGSSSSHFCPYMSLGYKMQFASNNAQSSFLYKVNAVVDKWRSKYPNGVLVGSDNFCPAGGCFGLLLGRSIVFYGFNPKNGGAFKIGAKWYPTAAATTTSNDKLAEIASSEVVWATTDDDSKHPIHKVISVLGNMVVFGVGLMVVAVAAATVVKKVRRRRKVLERRGGARIARQRRDDRKRAEEGRAGILRGGGAAKGVSGNVVSSAKRSAGARPTTSSRQKEGAENLASSVAASFSSAFGKLTAPTQSATASSKSAARSRAVSRERAVARKSSNDSSSARGDKRAPSSERRGRATKEVELLTVSAQRSRSKDQRDGSRSKSKDRTATTAGKSALLPPSYLPPPNFPDSPPRRKIGNATEQPKTPGRKDSGAKPSTKKGAPASRNSFAM